MTDELIKRSDVIDVIHERNEELLQHEEYRNKRGYIDLLGLIPKINCIRPVEVELIKHGKWIEKDGHLYCSECGEQAYGIEDWQWLNFIEIDSQYCPNCGARMDGEEDAD